MNCSSRMWNTQWTCGDVRNKGRKEMFYLTTHSTHFIYGYMASEHMVKDHSDSEKGNPLPPHGLVSPISSKVSFICIIPQTGWHIPRLLLHQSWSTGWNEKQLNGSTPWRIDPTTHRTMNERSYRGATSRSYKIKETSWWVDVVVAI